MPLCGWSWPSSAFSDRPEFSAATICPVPLRPIKPTARPFQEKTRRGPEGPRGRRPGRRSLRVRMAMVRYRGSGSDKGPPLSIRRDLGFRGIHEASRHVPTHLIGDLPWKQVGLVTLISVRCSANDVQTHQQQAACRRDRAQVARNGPIGFAQGLGHALAPGSQVAAPSPPWGMRAKA